MKRFLWVPAVSALLLALAGPPLFGGDARALGSSASAGFGMQGIQDSKPVDIDVTIGKKGGEDRWSISPVWLAIGGLGVMLLAVVVALSARGPVRTTIVSR